MAISVDESIPAANNWLRSYCACMTDSVRAIVVIRSISESCSLSPSIATGNRSTGGAGDPPLADSGGVDAQLASAVRMTAQKNELRDRSRGISALFNRFSSVGMAQSGFKG